MAGSGDLAVLRVCRFLRSRVHASTIVTYGSHMAIHMAVGFLFLGGGRYVIFIILLIFELDEFLTNVAKCKLNSKL